MYHFHQLPTAPAGQLVSWHSRVEVGRVEWALEFLRYRVLKLRANETYEMGEKHTNRTRPVRKIILRIMHSLMFNRTKVARVVQSPKRALITSTSSDPGPVLSFLSDGWNNVFYQMVVSDPCHSYLDNRETTMYSSKALMRVIHKTRSLHCLLPGELNRTFFKNLYSINGWNNVFYWMVASNRTK